MEFFEGTSSVLGRCVSAHIRAQLGAKRMSGKTLAARIGLSQNYVATRLRDEKPFTLDDVAEIVAILEPQMGVERFIADAVRDYTERVRGQLESEARRHAESLWGKPDAEWTDTDDLFISVHREIWYELMAVHGAFDEADSGPSDLSAARRRKTTVSDRSGNLRAAQQRNVQAEHEALDD